MAGGHTFASTSMVPTTYAFTDLTEWYVEKYVDCRTHVCDIKVVEWVA